MGYRLNPKVIHLGKELVGGSDYRDGREIREQRVRMHYIQV